MNCWPLISEFFAAELFAVMQVIQFRFGDSVFRKLNPEFWNPAVSHHACKKIFGYKVDAWHLCQSAALFCFFLPIIVPHNWQVFEHPYLDMGAKLVITGTEWVICFPVTYGLLSPYHSKKST